MWPVLVSTRYGKLSNSSPTSASRPLLIASVKCATWHSLLLIIIDWKPTLPAQGVLPADVHHPQMQIRL